MVDGTAPLTGGQFTTIRPNLIESERVKTPSRSRLEIVAQLFIQRLGQCKERSDAKKIHGLGSLFLIIHLVLNFPQISRPDQQGKTLYEDDIDLPT